MNTAVQLVIAILLGFCIGICQTFLFKRFPEKWLQDYDYDPKAPDFRLARRMKIVPHGILGGLFCAFFYAATVYFAPELINDGHFIRLIAIILVVPVLFLVLMSDKLNRIIPDEFWIFILICGVLLLVSDYVEGTPWFSSPLKWYMPLVNRVGAAVAGLLVLFLIGFIAEFFTAKTAMGQGDMKLLAACGMCTGFYGMVVLIYSAVLLAVFFAIPLLIKKQKRLKEEQRYIDSAENKVLAQLELKKKKEQMHYADDPDYLAFGPFIAIGAGIFMTFEPFFFEKMIDSLKLLGLFF